MSEIKDKFRCNQCGADHLKAQTPVFSVARINGNGIITIREYVVGMENLCSSDCLIKYTGRWSAESENPGHITEVATLSASPNANMPSNPVKTRRTLPTAIPADLTTPHD